MSAFIHRPEFFRRIHDTLCHHGRNSARESIIWTLGKDRVAIHPEVDGNQVRECHEEAHIWDFVRALEAAERYAVSARYEEAAQPSNLPAKPPRLMSMPMSHVALYKAMQSVSYQCAEGDTYECAEHGPTMATVAKLQKCLAETIIRALPQYDAADWS